MPKRFGSYLITLSLGAFNDNFFKMLLQLFVVQGIALKSSKEEYIGQTTFLFSLPFVLFGPWAGYLADRYSKSKLMVKYKLAELILMSIGALAFAINNVPLLFLLLFLMSAQSAFFGPAKLGVIPEMVKPEHISKANGFVEMFSILAVILGAASAGFLLKIFDSDYLAVSVFCILIAILGYLSSFKVPQVPPAHIHRPFPQNPIRSIFQNLAYLKAQRELFLASLAISFFWMVGLIFQMNILIYGEVLLGLGKERVHELAFLSSFIGLGIAVGSVLASRWSGKKIELGLVPMGGIGICIFSIALCFSHFSYSYTAALLFLAGTSGGLYIIPLYAYLQYYAKPDEKGRILAINGILNGLFLVLASFLYYFVTVTLGVSSNVFFLLLGVLIGLVVIYLCWILPVYFVRFVAWLGTHSLYSIKIEGSENVPQEGPVLLAPNHVSYVDAFLIGATLQRFIKFVMIKSIYRLPVIHFFCRLMGVIPISPSEGRDSVNQSLHEARHQLMLGEVVCIFPEGKITRDGQINSFRPGFETILENTHFPIIPVYLENVWGSVFSYDKKNIFIKLFKRFPYRITVHYGKALPATATALEVERAVRNLEAEAKRVN